MNSFDWQRFYDLDGARLLEMAKDYLRDSYDWVLIDSRTGVSDTAGICTIQMPDTVVACFTPNRQSILGVADVLQSIRDFGPPAAGGPAILFYPMATRIENLEPRKLEASRGYFRRKLARFLPDRFVDSPRDYWDSMEIPYKSGYAFEETLAAFGDSAGALGAADTMLAYMERMAQRIADDPTLRMPEIVEEERNAVLARYALEVAKAEAPPDAPPIPAPVPSQEDVDNDILRDVRAKEQLWRLNGYRWQDLMSIRELDLLTDKDKNDFGRNMTYYLSNSVKFIKFLSLIDRAFLSVMVLSILLSLLFISLRSLTESYYMQMGIWMLEGLVAIYIAWIVLNTGAALMLNRSAQKPQGIRLTTTLLFLLRGPVRAEIRDYDPEDERSRQLPAARKRRS